jgi:hypothetical protein
VSSMSVDEWARTDDVESILLAIGAPYQELEDMRQEVLLRLVVYDCGKEFPGRYVWLVCRSVAHQWRRERAKDEEIRARMVLANGKAQAPDEVFIFRELCGRVDDTITALQSGSLGRSVDVARLVRLLVELSADVANDGVDGGKMIAEEIGRSPQMISYYRRRLRKEFESKGGEVR